MVNFAYEFGQIMTRGQMSDFELTFGKFSVSRKPITNGGAIRPTGLLSLYYCVWTLSQDNNSDVSVLTHAILQFVIFPMIVKLL